MTLTELIEQLELIIKDHPHAASLNVRVRDSDLDVFAVNLLRDEIEEYVEIESFRPWALAEDDVL